MLNVIHGGPETGRALVDAAVDGVAFTGSAEVGRAIAQRMQEGPFARPALTEMGGKNPAIVERGRRSRQSRRGGGARGVRPLR